MAKKKVKAKSKKPAVKAKAKKAKAKKAKPAKKAKKAKKVKAKSKPKAKKVVKAKSKKSKPAKKSVKKAAKKPAKKVVKKVAKKAVKKAAKPVAKKKVAKVNKPASVKEVKAAKVNVPVQHVSTNHTPEVEEKAPFVPHATSLREGMQAPYFEGKDQHGNSVRSSDLMGKTIVLYFYPKDDTPGCTAESCSLRDEYQYMSNNNYAVVGVSADDVESHQRFADKYNLPFPLLADTDHNIIKAYDVWGQKMLAGNIYDGIVRTTFIIDGDGIIKNVITKVDTANHAKQVMEMQ